MNQNENLILTVNGGSSSVKLSLFSEAEENLLWSKNVSINLLDASSDEISSLLKSKLAEADRQNESIKYHVHRVVHGGDRFKETRFLDKELRNELELLSYLAPVHNPIALKLIDASARIFPASDSVVVFDTAFHSTIAPQAFIYALPYEWYQNFGIRRYGFHGINHKYCAAKTASILAENNLKIVIAHLGNGCSLSAVQDGKCIDTSMGYTPLEGLMMGTRSGSIDAGIIFSLLKEKKFTDTELNEILNNQSGLLGISGLSKDMREIESAMEEGHERAQLAFSIFVHRLSSGIAAMTSSLNGLDALVFTAGIGEHSWRVRKAVCRGLSFLGIIIDEQSNLQANQDSIISAPESAVKVLRIEAREDKQMFYECLNLKQNHQSRFPR